MEGQGIIGFLIVGLLAGWIAGQLIQGGGFGLFGNMIVGVIGAVIGGFVFQFLGIAAGGFVGSLVTAVVGAGILLYVAGLFQKKS